MRVLVTGGAGFVGSHLVDALLDAGHEVAVVDDLSTGLRENVPEAARFFQHDVRAPLDSIFAEVRPEVVMHLAAQVSVSEAVADPLRDESVNVGGTVNVMEAAARAGARKVVAVSSAAVYGDPASLPLTEESPAEPLSPYGISKLTGERYIRLLGRLRGIAFTIIRPANIYGPRQQAEGDGAVIPAFLGRFLSARDPVIHGDGSQTRDFIYVGDMVAALVRAMDRGDGLTLNVSTATKVSIRELWERLARLVGWERDPVFGPPRPGDIMHSVMANGRAREALDWAPHVDLQRGLEETVAWMRGGVRR